MHFFCIFLLKNLVMSKKSSTFAPAFEKEVLDLYFRVQKDCGNSSVGRARPCQGRGREFESRFPLFFFAQMAELVDACVSGAHAARCAGSSPVLGTQSVLLSAATLARCDAQVVKLVYTLL